MVRQTKQTISIPQLTEAAISQAVYEGFELGASMALDFLEKEIVQGNLDRQSPEYKYALDLTRRMSEAIKQAREEVMKRSQTKS